jgi:hypothetical protein
MALRILSGLIFIPRGGSGRGSVEISFDPFELANASNDLFELRKKREVGPAGRYFRSPASIIAARQFAITPIFGDREWRGRINDTVTRDSITISWNMPAGRFDQEEIPFMVIGDVGEFVPIPQPFPGRPARPGDRIPSDIRSRQRSRKRPARKKTGKKKRG